MRDLDAEIAAMEALQRSDPKKAAAEQPRIRKLAAEAKALADRARDLVRG